MTLADHGAEVIKIEPPGDGDPGRHLGISMAPSTVFFRNLNCGKKSVSSIFKQPAERARLLDLCERADVFVETFRRASRTGSASATRRSTRAIPASSIARSAPSARTVPIAPAPPTTSRSKR